MVPAPVTLTAPALALSRPLNSTLPVPVLREPPAPLVTERTKLVALLCTSRAPVVAVIAAVLPTVPDVSVTPVPPVMAAELVIEPLAPEVRFAVVLAEIMPELVIEPFAPEVMFAVVLAEMTPELLTLALAPEPVRVTLEPVDVSEKAFVTPVAPASKMEPVALNGLQLAVAPTVFVAEILPELLKLPTCSVFAKEALLIVTDVGPGAAAL